MKRLLGILAVAGLFAVTGCNKTKCWNCECDIAVNRVSSWSEVDNTTGVTTTGSTESNEEASSSQNPACEGDEIVLGSSNMHFVAAENMDGTHTYVDTEVYVDDNGWSTTTTTTLRTTTYTCSCSEVD